MLLFLVLLKLLSATYCIMIVTVCLFVVCACTCVQDWLDDAPAQVSDPSVSQPEDWDEEEDGEWEAPQVLHTTCNAALREGGVRFCVCARARVHVCVCLCMCTG